MEGITENKSEDIVSADYDFEIKTAMERTKDNSSFMAGMVALSFPILLFSFCPNFFLEESIVIKCDTHGLSARVLGNA